MKIKATLKKLKRGDVVSIDWIDAGDIEDSSSSWFSQEGAEKVFKEIPVQTIAVYFGHGKENLFSVRDTEKQDLSSLYHNGACVIPIGCIRSVEKLSNFKMNLHTKPEKSINLPRKLDASVYLQKKLLQAELAATCLRYKSAEAARPHGV